MIGYQGGYVNMKKKRIFTRPTAFVLAIIMCACAFIFAPSDIKSVSASTIAEDKKAIQQKEDELARITKQRKEAQNALANLQSDQASMIQKKAAMDTQISTLTKEVAMLQSLIEDYEKQIVNTEAQIKTTQAQTDKTYEQFRMRVRSSYEEGLVSYAELVLSADSFSDFLSRMDIVGSLLDYDKNVVKKLTEQRKELEQSKAELQDLKRSTEQKNLEAKEQEASLVKAKADLESYIADIRSNMAMQTRLIKEAQAAEAEINAKLEQMLRDLAAKESASYVGGQFNWPVPVSYKRISSKFGWRVLNGVNDKHGGIDIPCPTGEKVMASNSGTVVVAEYHYSYGNYVLINHGGGYSTLYAHNSELLVSVGDVVSQGQVIAHAGNTGNSYGSHCHFEVRVNGERMDPMNYVTPPNGWYYS